MIQLIFGNNGNNNYSNNNNNNDNNMRMVADTNHFTSAQLHASQTDVLLLLIFICFYFVF